jgi:hypothetical protein
MVGEEIQYEAAWTNVFGSRTVLPVTGLSNREREQRGIPRVTGSRGRRFCSQCSQLNVCYYDRPQRDFYCVRCAREHGIVLSDRDAFFPPEPISDEPRAYRSRELWRESTRRGYIGNRARAASR